MIMSESTQNVNFDLTEFIRELTLKYDDRYASSAWGHWDSEEGNYEIKKGIKDMIDSQAEELENTIETKIQNYNSNLGESLSNSFKDAVDGGGIDWNDIPYRNVLNYPTETSQE